MNTNELFVESNKLPKALSKVEVYELFEKFYAGNYSAREKIIIHNIKLVIYKVINKYNFVLYDKKDLVSIGIIGLTKAVDTFDISKNYEFSTYAARCIENEILMFLRHLKVRSNVASFDEVVGLNYDLKNIELKDIINNGVNLEEDYILKEEHYEIRSLVEKLPEREKEIIKLYFGFYGLRYNQKEIAKKLNIHQSYVCRIIKSVLIDLKEKLCQKQNNMTTGSDKDLIKKFKKTN